MPKPDSAIYGVRLSQRLLEPLENLQLLGSRAVLALLGIAVGCGVVIALLNIGHNAKLQSLAIFKGMGSELMVVHVQPASDSQPSIRHIPTARDSPKILEALPDFQTLALLAVTAANAHISGRTLHTLIVGATPELTKVLNLQINQGRLLSNYDVSSTYSILGWNAAISLSTNKKPVAPGAQIQLGDYLFQVAGTLQAQEPNPLLPFTIDDMVLVPLESMRRIVNSSRINTILAQSNSEQPQAAAALLEKHLQSLWPDHAVHIQTPQQLLSGITQQSRLFSGLIIGLGGISLLVGGVGIMNVMLMNVAERRQEIGIRLAIGARRRDIAYLFLLEAMALAVMGSLFGMLLGTGATWVFSILSAWESFSLSPLSILIGMLSSILTGLFFGLNPALSAARLRPVQALRDA